MTAMPCQRCESPLASSDLRCAICGLPAVAAEPGGQEAVEQVLRCNGCGAAVAYRAEVQAPRCDFCGEVMELETPDDPVEQAEAFVRFRVTPDQARAALEAWLGSRGFFRPSDLRAKAKLHELKPLWWAGWMFDADVLMSWAADSDADARRSQWAPHAGQARVSMRRTVVPASRGLELDECVALLPFYDVSDTTPEPEQAFREATVEQFVLQRSRRSPAGPTATSRSRCCPRGSTPGTWRFPRTCSRIATERSSIGRSCTARPRTAWSGTHRGPWGGSSRWSWG
jgi:hypothetical protein